MLYIKTPKMGDFVRLVACGGVLMRAYAWAYARRGLLLVVVAFCFFLLQSVLIRV